VPSPDTITQFNFVYEASPPVNLTPMTLKELKIRKIISPQDVQKVSYGSIAQTVEITEAALVYILKQIIMAIETAMHQDYSVKLNCKVGLLRFLGNRMVFENSSSSGAGDATTVTSCNSEFRGNKRYLTNLKYGKFRAGN